MKSRSAMDRFLDHVLLGDGCWEWQSKGTIRLGGRDTRSIAPHKVAAYLFLGVPTSTPVFRACKNKLCVRPDHLQVGIVQQGSHHHRAKLDDAAVRAILEAKKKGHRVKNIAEEYGVSSPTVCKIVARQAWRHVDDSNHVHP